MPTLPAPRRYGFALLGLFCAACLPAFADRPAPAHPEANPVKTLDALALQPDHGKPGNVETLIDGLTRCKVDGGRGGAQSEEAAHDPNYAHLELLGFEAVPALLDHLGDQRHTRSVTVGFDNFPTLPRCVGEVVSDLIEGLAGPQPWQDWVLRQQGNPTNVGAARQWWKKARVEGEEAYVCRHMFPAKKGEYDRINEVCLRLVAAHYPRRLGEIYLRLLSERPDLDAYDVVQTISKSDGLGRDEKIRLFHQGARHADLRQRARALDKLLALEPAKTEARIVAEFDRLPVDVNTPYLSSPEAWMPPRLALATSSPSVWEAFRRTARRDAVGLRLQMLEPLGSGLSGVLTKERLATLAAFLDDETTRTVAESDKERGRKYGNVYAADNFPVISVRDFAAMRIGLLLGVHTRPQPAWTPERWAAYRATVQAALARQPQ